MGEIMDFGQQAKIAKIHPWESLKDVIFYQPIMLRNARKSLEIEVIRGNTERAKEIISRIPSEVQLIKAMV
jgi:hypothetical protein